MEFNYKETSGQPEEDIEETVSRLEPYLEHLKDIYESHDYAAPEASLCLPDDQEIFERTMELLGTHNTHELKYIFLIGIGGSNLGTKAVYDALRGYGESVIQNEFPKIVFVDTVSATLLQAVETHIAEGIENPEEVLINIVSKSGMTLETIANAEIVLAMLRKKFGDVNSRIIVTTDEGSKLAQWAEEAHADTLYIPKNVGGRYSVLSPSGLFPLGLCGFDIEQLRLGADSQNSFAASAKDGPAPALSAAAAYLNLKNGAAIYDHFFFAPELESLGKWCRQLIAESLGKRDDLDGNATSAGLTPTVSIGSTDLHSMAQLYFGGPHDKYTMFAAPEAREKGNDIRIPENEVFSFLNSEIADIHGKPASEIMNTIYEGVKTSYRDAKLPFAEIALGRISEYSLGAFMQFKMIETMCLAKLLNVNAFDQPEVERYKKEVRRLLNDN